MWCYCRNQEISEFVAISMVHSTFPHWRKDQTASSVKVCLAPAHSPDTLDGNLVGTNVPGTSILPKTTRTSRSEAMPPPSFAQNLNLSHIPVGQRNCFQPFRAHKDILSSGTGGKGTLWPLWTAIIIIILIILIILINFHSQSTFKTSADTSPQLLVKENNNYSPADIQGWQGFLGGQRWHSSHTQDPWLPFDISTARFHGNTWFFPSYQEEVQEPTFWCSQTSLTLHPSRKHCTWESVIILRDQRRIQ